LTLRGSLSRVADSGDSFIRNFHHKYEDIDVLFVGRSASLLRRTRSSPGRSRSITPSEILLDRIQRHGACSNGRATHESRHRRRDGQPAFHDRDSLILSSEQVPVTAKTDSFRMRSGREEGRHAGRRSRGSLALTFDLYDNKKILALSALAANKLPPSGGRAGFTF